MFAASRSKRVSIFSRSGKSQHSRRRDVRAIMEAAEPRVLLTTYTVNPVYTFTNDAKGATPQTPLILVNGNLYGTTGAANGTGFQADVFEIPAGSTTPTVLGTLDDTGVMTPLVYDGNGHIFGATADSGTSNQGSVYEVNLTGATPTVTTIASFDDQAEGATEGTDPVGELAVDPSGNLYGVTYDGGGAGMNGTVFEIADPSGNSPTIQTLASFDPTTDGADPNTGVVYYNGALYGTTVYTPNNNEGNGEIFKYDISSHTITPQVLWNGDVDLDGSLNPLIVDSSGDLFTTSTSGAQGNEDGSLFEVTPGSTSYETLATLDGSNNGASGPIGPITIGPDGNYYGMTVGSGDTTTGAIFEVDATTHQPSTIGYLSDNVTGDNPNGGLVFVGNSIYGTASGGGADNDGTVFELTAAGPPAKLVFTTEPTGQTASGTLTGNVVVQVEDANGDLITNDTSNVTLSVATPSGIAFGTDSTATVAAVGGIATFNNLVLNKADTYTLSATDTDSGTALTPATSTSFTITHAAATQLAFATQPTSNVAVGANFGPVVLDVEDAYGNLVTNNVSAVTLGINSGGVSGESITGTTTAAAVAGVATFNNISMPDDGTYKLSATDTGLTGAVSSSFIVGNGVNQAGPATQVVITNNPTVTPGNPTVVNTALEDANGNVETTDNTSTITLAINGPNGVTDVPLTVTNGVATFNLSLSDPGNYSFSASSGSLVSTNTSTQTLTYTTTQPVITSAVASPGEPDGVVIAGQKIKPITLSIYSGTTIADAKVKVTLKVLTPSGAVAYGPVTVTTKTGQATFKNIYFKKAADGYQLEAVTAQYPPAYSTIFNVIPAAPKKISFVTQPGPATHGTPFSTSVKVVDAYGNAEINSPVVLTSKGQKGASALSGTTTVDTVNGVADFDNLLLATAGDYTLTATDGKLKATSKKFVVS